MRFECVSPYFQGHTGISAENGSANIEDWVLNSKPVFFLIFFKHFFEQSFENLFVVFGILCFFGTHFVMYSFYQLLTDSFYVSRISAKPFC